MYSLSHPTFRANEGPCFPFLLVSRFDSSEYTEMDRPSCKHCNNKFGAMEEKLFVRFAMCVDPRKQAASGVWMKARRALGIGVTGLTESEKRIRKALKDEIIGKAKIYDKSAEASVIPGFGPHVGFPNAPQIQIEIPDA